MKATEKRGLVPKLRFPEFREAGEWKERTLSDVLLEHGQKSTGVEKVFSVSVHKGLVNQIEHLGRSFSASSTDHYNRVLPGDIVYTKSPTGDFPLGIIKQNKISVPVIVSPLYGVFSPETNALGAILDAYFESPKNAYRYLEPLVQKGAKNTININNKKFLSGALILPMNKEEQRKIADCLTSLDELITLEAQQLDTLKTHKKGLMQQLFPAEGETLPKLRFPEFRDAGEWCSDPLGTIFDTSSGGTPDRTKKEYWNGNIPWITTSLVDFNIITETVEFITDAGLSNSSAKVFPEKTILVAMYGQGKTRGQVAMLGVKAATNQACAAILPREEIDPHFVFLNLCSRYEEMRRLSNSGGQENLSQGLIQGLQFFYPDDKDEQRAIANCLTSHDDLIAAQAQKLETLKTHKKGLMQQLFPALDKVGA